MNKLTILLLLPIFFSSCQIDDVKNTYTISGRVGTNGMTWLIEDLTVSLISGDHVIATSGEEEFRFENLEEGKPYIIIPHSTVGSRSGVSTLDWVLVEKYINGEKNLTPFQKLAADVNKNDLISTEDMELIRTCILGDDCFSWRFASEDYDGNSQGYLDQYVISKLVSDQEVNFVPIKLGDVNNTIGPN